MKNLITKEKFGPWAVVTGASSGIGKEFAKQLAANRINLVLAARRVDALEALGKELKNQYNIDYRALKVDLAEENAFEKITEAVEDLNVGLLISNAGTGAPGEFLSSELSDLMRIVRLNAVSHLSLIHYFGRKMAVRGGGGVILTGAMGAVDGIPYMANESGTKSYVQALGKALHTEFQKSGIHMTVLIASPTDTPILSTLGFSEGALPLKPISVEQCVREALSALMQNRMAVIPGRKFRLMKALTPASVSRKMMGKILKKLHRIS